MSELKDRADKLVEYLARYTHKDGYALAKDVTALIKDQQARIEELDAAILKNIKEQTSKVDI